MANKRVISTEIDLANQLSNRDVDKKLNKYITDIGSDGIQIHPEVWQDESTYVQLDGEGMDIIDKNGDVVSSYGAEVQIGKNEEQHVEISTNATVYYDEHGEPIAEISQGDYGYHKIEEVMEEILDFGYSSTLKTYTLPLEHNVSTNLGDTLSIYLTGQNKVTSDYGMSVDIPVNGDSITKYGFTFTYNIQQNAIIISNTVYGGIVEFTDSSYIGIEPGLYVDFKPRSGDEINVTVISEGYSDYTHTLIAGEPVNVYIDEYRGYLTYDGIYEIYLSNGTSEDNQISISYVYPYPYFYSEEISHWTEIKLPFYSFGIRDKVEDPPGAYSVIFGEHNTSPGVNSAVFGEGHNIKNDNGVIIGQYSDEEYMEYEPLYVESTEVFSNPNFPVVVPHKFYAEDIFSIVLEGIGEADEINFPIDLDEEALTAWQNAPNGMDSEGYRIVRFMTITFKTSNRYDIYSSYPEQIPPSTYGGTINVTEYEDSLVVTTSTTHTGQYVWAAVGIGSYYWKTEDSEFWYEIELTPEDVPVIIELEGTDPDVSVVTDSDTSINIASSVWEGKMDSVKEAIIQYAYDKNIYDSETAPLIVGSGLDDEDRRNAFIVGWDGNVRLGLNTNSSTLDEEIYRSIFSLGWDGDCITDSSMLKLKEWIRRISEQTRYSNAVGIWNYSNNTAVANSNISNKQVYTLPSSFNGGSYDHNLIYSKDIYDEDQNGFKLLRSGLYRLHARAHINQASGSCCYHVTFYDWTASTIKGSPFYVYSPVAYASVENTWIGSLEKGHVIVPRLYRYSTGVDGAKWRPAYVNFTIELLQTEDDEYEE